MTKTNFCDLKITLKNHMFTWIWLLYSYKIMHWGRQNSPPPLISSCKPQLWGFCWAKKNPKICTISVFSMSVTPIELGSFPNTQSLTYTWRDSLRDILSRILNKPDQQCLDEWQQSFYHKKMIFCGTFLPFFFKMDFSVIFSWHIFLRKFFKQAFCAGCRRSPFPKQLHQKVKSTHLAKSP